VAKTPYWEALIKKKKRKIVAGLPLLFDASFRVAYFFFFFTAFFTTFFAAFLTFFFAAILNLTSSESFRLNRKGSQPQH
jgi:hypothetical protein